MSEVVYTYECCRWLCILREVGKVRVNVDPDECTGCALCVETCPEVFEMVGDLAVARQGEVLPGVEESCMQAVEDCPVEAIRVYR